MPKRKYSKWMEKLIDEVYISIEEEIQDLANAGINISWSDFINKLINNNYEVEDGNK